MTYILYVLAANIFAFSLIVLLNRIAHGISRSSESIGKFNKEFKENQLEILKVAIQRINYDTSIRELHHRLQRLEGKPGTVPTMMEINYRLLYLEGKPDEIPTMVKEEKK